MLKPPKPPPKPRKSKYQTQEEYDEEVKEWEAKKHPKLKTESGGHHMTQDCYTKNLLPHYIKMVQSSRLHNTLEDIHWLLQEDGDPSHGTKSVNNIAEDLRQVNWIAVIIHPAQSPDLNPIEGVWLILKERTKKRSFYPGDEPAWDGTKNTSRSYSMSNGIR